jgi:hypothetical protein
MPVEALIGTPLNFAARIPPGSVAEPLKGILDEPSSSVALSKRVDVAMACHLGPALFQSVAAENSASTRSRFRDDA